MSNLTNSLHLDFISLLDSPAFSDGGTRDYIFAKEILWEFIEGQTKYPYEISFEERYEMAVQDVIGNLADKNPSVQLTIISRFHFYDWSYTNGFFYTLFDVTFAALSKYHSDNCERIHNHFLNLWNEYKRNRE